MVVIEAFRSGTPVVASRRGPYPEIIGDSGGGLLFETTAELREALSRLATAPDLRAQLGRAARRAYEESWSEQPVLERYFDVIRRIARERGDRRVLDRVGSGSPPA